MKEIKLSEIKVDQVINVSDTAGMKILDFRDGHITAKLLLSYFPDVGVTEKMTINEFISTLEENDITVINDL